MKVKLEVDLGPPSPPGSATKRISGNCPGVISLVHKNLLPDPFPLQWIKETGRVDFSSFKGGVARPWTGEWPARGHAAKKRTHVATTQPSLQPSLPNCSLAAHPTSSWTFLHTSLPLALALGQLLDTREAESSRGGSLRTTPQRRARSPRWDCSRPLQGGRPESRSPRGRGSRMLANKNPESPHRLETSSRREDPLSKPSLGSWALEVVRPLRQGEPWEGLGTVDEGPAGQEGAAGGRRRLVLQMVGEIPGENQCSGLTHKSHPETAAHTQTHPERHSQADTHTHTKADTGKRQLHSQNSERPT